MILQIALDTPLRRVFDYQAPELSENPRLGVRVRVPFGRRQMIGILVGIAAGSLVPAGKLKSALAILDHQPVLDPVTFYLLLWAAEYYHHPLGEVFAAALPASLRAGEPALHKTESWAVSELGQLELSSPRRRAPQQRALLAWLKGRGHATADEVGEHFKLALWRVVKKRHWVALQDAPPEAPVTLKSRPSEVALTAAQTECVAAILAAAAGAAHGAAHGFSAHLVYGVTGSGKTEVYLRVIAAALARGGQALVLVPEIALTPQLVDRFRGRFSSGVVAVHSGLTGVERRDAWRAAHTGQARIIIGTRSAVFTSMPNLALVVVDEEHDGSYKQQEGFRYSARDLAVLRARSADVPIILGSATPSLETLENAATGGKRTAGGNHALLSPSPPRHRQRIVPARGSRLHRHRSRQWRPSRSCRRTATTRFPRASGSSRRAARGGAAARRRGPSRARARRSPSGPRRRSRST